ncbi:hypothetical protein HOLleu_12074 [Holothuria leucospilota]|uniref:Uncharacterized protein n=1 Tax=Holothuria leucospilota TaxID=206669 RepID=A0A9Q1CAB2_HOLLE|nr:hypothetical protein HOLleu_12074 [Holothuria leucospilota]
MLRTPNAQYRYRAVEHSSLTRRTTTFRQDIYHKISDTGNFNKSLFLCGSKRRGIAWEMPFPAICGSSGPNIFSVRFAPTMVALRLDSNYIAKPPFSQNLHPPLWVYCFCV